MPLPYTLSDLRDAASAFFGATTGASPRIAAHYNSLSADFLARPMTPDNVSEFVRRENQAVMNSPLPATPVDRVAIAAIPFRATLAHLAAQNVTLGREGFFSNNPYAQEALQSIVSGN